MNSEAVIFNGITFRRYPESTRASDRNYFRPHAGHIRKGVGYLHQEVWKAEHGAIPAGYEIHHGDHNPLNNAIDNLGLLPISAHKSYHGKLNGDKARERIPQLVAKAAAWHRSEAAKPLHSRLGHLTWEKREAEERTCEQCGKAYGNITHRDGDRFCSNACKSAWRRQAKLDDEPRPCAICGTTFTVHRYSPRQACGAACKLVLRRRNQALATA